MYTVGLLILVCVYKAYDNYYLPMKLNHSSTYYYYEAHEESLAIHSLIPPLVLARVPWESNRGVDKPMYAHEATVNKQCVEYIQSII